MQDIQLNKLAVKIITTQGKHKCVFYNISNFIFSFFIQNQQIEDTLHYYQQIHITRVSIH